MAFLQLNHGVNDIFLSDQIVQHRSLAKIQKRQITIMVQIWNEQHQTVITTESRSLLVANK